MKIPIVTELVRVVTYYKKLPSLNSYDPLTTWFCDINILPYYL